MSPVSHTPVTPLRFLERSAKVYPDKVAIVHGDRRTNYPRTSTDKVQKFELREREWAGRDSRIKG